MVPEKIKQDRLIRFLSTFSKGRSIDDIPSKLEPFSDEDFDNTILSMKFRQPIENEFLEEVGVDDAEELMEQINTALQKQVPDRDVGLENRNFIAASGNALIITFMGWINKYPLNEFLGPLLAAESEKHAAAFQLYEEWCADENKHKLPFSPSTKFGIPPFRLEEDIYTIKYVGRSIDILTIEELIKTTDPSFEERLKKLYPFMSLGQMTPAQLVFYFRRLLYKNIPQLRDIDIERSELLSAILHSAYPCITKEHVLALNSFLDYAYDNGFVYLDKIIDNATLDEEGILYLIDYGVAQTFEKGHSTISKENYNNLRDNLINEQIQLFVIE